MSSNTLFARSQYNKDAPLALEPLSNRYAQNAHQNNSY